MYGTYDTWTYSSGFVKVASIESLVYLYDYFLQDIDFTNMDYLGGYWENDVWNEVAMPDGGATQSVVISVTIQ